MSLCIDDGIGWYINKNDLRVLKRFVDNSLNIIK